MTLSLSSSILFLNFSTLSAASAFLPSGRVLCSSSISVGTLTEVDSLEASPPSVSSPACVSTSFWPGSAMFFFGWGGLFFPAFWRISSVSGGFSYFFLPLFLIHQLCHINKVNGSCCIEFQSWKTTLPTWRKKYMLIFLTLLPFPLCVVLILW